MKGEIVKKPNELIKMRGEFSESELKLSTYLITKLEEEKQIYRINVKDYLEKFDKKIGDFEYLYEVALNLSRKQFKMVDRVNNRFSIYNFFGAVDYQDGILEVEFSSKLMRYLLQIKNNYLKYEIKNIMSLDSKYSIRLYEILKNKYEKTKKFRNEIELKISVSELREILSVPRSYVYGMFKKRILEKTQLELKEKTDILFDFEEIKSGRKVTHLKFLIKPNPKKVKPKPKLQTQTEVKHKKDDFKDWRKELLKKEDVILKIDSQIFEIQDGLLARDEKILDKEEAWKTWKFLFKNRDKISFLNRSELKEEVKEDVKFKILNTFKDKLFKAIPVIINGQTQYVNANLIDIRDFKSVDDFTAIFRSGKKMFEMKMSINRLNNFLK